MSSKLQQFEQFVKSLPFPVAMFDREMHYVAFSDEWVRAYHLPHSDVLGRSHYEVFPCTPDKWKRIFEECLEGKRNQGEKELFLRADGQEDYINWTAQPWLDEEGQVGGLMMYSEVVTKQVEIERKLEEGQDFMKILFEQSPIGLNLCRLDGLWLESNPAFLDIIGYSREEADGGLTYWQLTPSKYNEDERVQLESLEREGKYGPYEKEFIRKDGTLVPVRLNGFLIERDGQRYIWSLIENVTERKKLEERLENERVKAIRNSKLATLGEMAAGIAHEINNPLTIIDGYVRNLLRIIEAGDRSKLLQAVERLESATSRAATIVKGLRKFSRQESVNEAEVIKVGSIIHDTLDLCHERLKKEGVELEVKGDDEVNVLGRSVELSQVLLNLLLNAFHAVENQPQKSITIEYALNSRRGRALITVKDSGPGIPEEYVDKIFNPFFTTKQVGKGTGLGLSISKGIVEDHGGTLSYARKDGWTCFTVELPSVEDGHAELRSLH